MNQAIYNYSKRHFKKNPAQVKPGDWIKVHQRFVDDRKTRVQVVEGVVIAQKHGKGMDATFTLRRIASAGIGVEQVFPLHSPSIIKIERTKTSRVRRAKLHYLRNLKSSKIQLKGEKRSPKSWEEPLSEEELEKIKRQKEAAAKIKAEKKRQQREELDKKFAQAQAQRKANL
jgi:large subunit ribosomal protein L19